MTTRRSLLQGVAAAGGLNAAIATLAALGGMATTPAQAQAPRLPPPGNRRQPVVVIGAGIAGLVVALELKRAGWPVQLLEAQDRPGGRCRTLRAGDVVTELDGTTQRVEWDSAPHLYLNPGPARIPHHHRGILSYCRQLGVALEVLVNENRAALVQAGPNGPVPLRRVQADLRGVVAELAAKGLERSALDAVVAEADIAALREMLRGFGALDRGYRYRGTSRAGWDRRPGVEREGEAVAPLDLRILLQPEVWRSAAFSEGIDYAATMLQPVGGMDRIAQAFATELGPALVLNAEVMQLRRTAQGARITWRDRASGRTQQVQAGLVVVTLPAPVLAALDTDFSEERQTVLARLDYAPAFKLGFQAEQRFWEDDHAIYGGISWTGRDIGQVWYPSHGFHQRRGILLGSYLFGGRAGEAYTRRTPAERAAAAIEEGQALHPDYARQVAQPVSVAWAKQPFQRGAWVEWVLPSRIDGYRLLRRSEGPYHFAGEHLSYQTAWMEGAVLSAWSTLEDLAKR